MTHVLIFGDSITYGAWDKEGGWANRLRIFLDEKYTLNPSNEHYMTYNLGISGDNTNGLASRFENEIKRRLDIDEDSIIIIAIGINDSQFLINEKVFRVSPDAFKNNIKNIIDMSKKISSKILLLGLTPVDDSRTNPIPWNAIKSYKNEFVKKYDEILKNVCTEKDVYFLPLFESLANRNDLLEDGLHPNTEGHEIIFEAVKNFLIENKII